MGPVHRPFPPGPGPRRGAARTIGTSGRTHRDKVVAVAYSVFLIVGACGGFPLLFLAGLCWLYAAARSRRLDVQPWVAATPVTGARRFLVSEVHVGKVHAGYCRGFRWWRIVDEGNRPVFGRCGMKKGSPVEDLCIIPSSGSPLLALQALTVPGFWTSNCTVYRSQHDKGFTVLHLCRATGEPVLAVRFADPRQRREIEVLVYSPEVLGDVAVAVLSCAAIFVKHGRPHRSRAVDGSPALPDADGTPGWGGTSHYLVDAGCRTTDEAWPRVFFGNEMQT